jgi:N6-adenosine-specific RNA methylase IME4
MGDIIKIKISEIKIGDRFRKRMRNIEELAGSIAINGLLQPIIVSPGNNLIAGARRIAAMQMLKKTDIEARSLSLNDLIDAEIDENNQREPFAITEKVAIAQSLEAKVGKRQGKKPANNKNQELTNPETFPEVGMETRDFVAKRAGLGSGKTYQHAKHVIEHAIPDVVEAMDRNAISIYCAYSISKEKKNKQLTLLNESIHDPSSAAEDLKALNDKRRSAKRQKRFKIPDGPGADPIYNIIRVAPDWSKELQEDIEAMPVADYCTPTAVVAVECPGDAVARAIKAIEAWGFTYRAIVTTYNHKYDPNDTAHLNFISAPSWHVLIATVDPVLCGAHTAQLSPARTATNPQAALLDMIAELWPDKKDPRIDMSATAARKGWKIWKIDYAKPKE